MSARFLCSFRFPILGIACLWLRRTSQAVSLCLMVAASMSAQAGWLGLGDDSWKEEVLLHDGRKIVVERTVDRGGRHEIGQRSPFKEQSLRFSLPGANQQIIWEDHYSEDVGSANFLPMLLDIVNGTPYLVLYPMGCLSYNKWGRPNPPYVIFKYQGKKEWKQVPLQELPTEIKTPNLIFSMPDIVVEKSGKNFITAEMIREIVSNYSKLEYKTILREAVKNAGGSRCGEMVYDGKGGWIGIGWFRDQPTYEACLKYCEQQKIGKQYCPCETLFKGK